VGVPAHAQADRAQCHVSNNEWAKSRDRNIYVTDDTQIMAHLDDERASTKLESVAVRLGVPIITYPDSDVSSYPARKLAERNAIHAQATRQIHDMLEPKLGKARLLYRDVLCPATETMAELHINGLAYSESRRLAALKKIEVDGRPPWRYWQKSRESRTSTSSPHPSG